MCIRNKQALYINPNPTMSDKNHRCKKTFLRFYYFLIKNAFFNDFYFLERFLFSIGKICYPTKPAKILLNLLNFCIKRLLSDGFNVAVIGNSLPKPLNVVMHIKTVILLRNFSFGVINFVNLSIMFYIQHFLTFFIFFIKNAFFNVFYSWGQRFLHL